MYVITKMSGDIFKYSKNGLLKESTEHFDCYHVTTKYNYNNKQRICSMSEQNGYRKWKLTYNKKNQLIKAVCMKKSKKEKVYQYSWKRNRMLKRTLLENGYWKAPRNYTYNKKGDLIKYVDDDSGKIIYYCNIIYKQGKPVSIMTRSSGSKFRSQSIICKAINVPKRYVKTVEAQQRMIRNRRYLSQGTLELGLYRIDIE